MSKIPVALQLYSVREDCAKDFPATVKAVAEMGYDGVEFAGYYDHSAQQIKQLLDDNNLKCAGTHTGLDTLNPENIKRTIEFNQAFDNPYLIVPGVGREYHGSKENLDRFADALTKAADVAREHGAFVGYHNHSVDFTPLEDGTLPMRYLFQNTPDNVILQLDTGNALEGGSSAIPLIEEFPGRSKTIHLKEYSATDKNAFVGKGEVDWQQVFQSCESVGGTQWYIVEVEQYPQPPLDCARESLENVRKLLEG